MGFQSYSMNLSLYVMSSCLMRYSVCYELNTLDACWIAVDVWSNSSRCRQYRSTCFGRDAYRNNHCIDIVTTLHSSINCLTVICSPHYKKYAHMWCFLKCRWWIRHKSMTISSEIVVNRLRGSNLHINYDDVSQKRRNRIRWDRHNFYDDCKNVVTCSNYVDMSLVGPLYPTSS